MLSVVFTHVRKFIKKSLELIHWSNQVIRILISNEFTRDLMENV